MTAEAASILLAAGKGTRMKSDLPKVLHAVASAPMVAHALRTAESAADRIVVVTGHQGERVRKAVANLAPRAVCVEQSPQLGTGHAVMQARAALDGFTGDVFVLFADTPLVRPETLEAMKTARRDGASVVVLGFEAAEPGGYGRLIRGANGDLDRIVEAKDASPDELQVTLCNSGVMCIDGAVLFSLLDRVTDENANKEYYLTDIVALARGDGLSCAVVVCPEEETLGVNSRVDLAAAEAAFQARARDDAMRAGVTMIAPETVFLAHDTVLGRDVIVEPNVFFGPGVTVASGVHIKANCHLEGCSIGTGSVIGPFARLRPGAVLDEDVRVGNFVEIKNTGMERGAKANHLTYLGDASVGAGANVGAGTITCNYDGYLKHRTEIADGAFIGSNTALVAPVRVGARAIVGAGSVINSDVADDALAIARGRQQTKEGLAAMLHEKLAAAKASLKRR